MNPEDLVEEIESLNDPKGNLVLVIYCNDCNSQFEINSTSIAMAAITGTSVIEYINWVQNSICKKCNTVPK